MKDLRVIESVNTTGLLIIENLRLCHRHLFLRKRITLQYNRVNFFSQNQVPVGCAPGRKNALQDTLQPCTELYIFGQRKPNDLLLDCKISKTLILNL